MKRISGKIAFAALAALVPSIGLTGGAGAHHAALPDPLTGCAQPVAANLTLTHDVGPCTGHGLVVTADNITINLNGNKIIGDGNLAEENAGVFLNGRTGVTITDSNNVQGNRVNQITAFNAGVAIHGGSNNTIERLNVVGNVGVGDFVGPLGNWGDGIQVVDSGGTSLSNGNKIKHNTVSGNGGFGGITLLGNSDFNTMEDNVVVGNLATSTSAAQTVGIRLEQKCNGATDNNSIKNNTVSDNQLDGIEVFFGTAPGFCGGTNSDLAATGNVIENNTVEGNLRDGIRLAASRVHSDVSTSDHVTTAAQSNTVRDNTVCAQDVNGSGIVLYGHTNTIVRNQVGDGALKVYVARGSAPGPCVPNSPVFGDVYDDHLDCTHNSWGTGSNKNTFVQGDPDCIEGAIV